MDVNDLLSTGVVAAVIVLIFLSTVRRMLDLQKIPLFMWPVLLLAGAMPSFMAYTVLNPGEVFDKAEVRAQKDTFKLQIPADGEYALMVTALLGPVLDAGSACGGGPANDLEHDRLRRLAEHCDRIFTKHHARRLFERLDLRNPHEVSDFEATCRMLIDAFDTA